MSSIPPPRIVSLTPSRVLAAARELGFDLDEAEIGGYLRAVERKRESYARVRQLAGAPPKTAGTGRTGSDPAAPNPHNAWATMTHIPGSGSGPLAGWRVAVKDTIGVAGIPLRAGSAFLGEIVPHLDATVVSRLLAAGAEITGIARCEDLGFSGHSFTGLGGAVTNPYDPSRSTGGSSSGCAALVAAGEVDVAIGGDQGGSVTGPASWSGICGLKPTFGSVPYTGALPGVPSVDHLGPMARSVLEIAAVLEVIAGPDGVDPRQGTAPGYRPGEVTGHVGAPFGMDPLSGVRVGVLEEGFDWPGLSLAAVDATVRASAARFRALGASVRAVSIPGHRDARHMFTPLMSEGSLALLHPLDEPGWEGIARVWPGAGASISLAWAERAAELPVAAKVAFITGLLARSETGGEVAALARCLVAELTSAYDALFDSVDLVVMPTQPGVAATFPGRLEADEFVDVALGMSVNTCATNLTGHPALSLPCGAIDGLPVGMLIVGAREADISVLRAGHAFQSLVFRMPPPAPGPV
ncbi:MAG: amidase [Burkholderiaceae bacterium]|nr:amidase [Microbacteriaceae bacterium]